MNKLTYIICAIFLSGCSLFVLKNPTLDDITGVWESVGPMPYAKLIIEPGGDNIVVVMKNKDEAKILEFRSFKSEKNGFSCEIIGLDKNGESTRMNGFVLNDRIALIPEKNEKTTIWFVRENDLKQYQSIVAKAVKEHNKRLNSNAVKSAAPVN